MVTLSERLRERLSSFHTDIEISDMVDSCRREWLSHRDPRYLPQYRVEYQSEVYDQAMRNYGDVWYADEDTTDAFNRVMWAMDIAARQKHDEFVQRSVC